MDVKHYKDADDNWYIDIVSRQYNRLRELETEHEKLGRKTWVSLYNSCEGQWMLTVMIGRAA